MGSRPVRAKATAAKRRRSRPRGGASLPCTCRRGGPTRVLETRRQDSTVVRLRQCRACGRRFKTTESAP